jgi:hypothetical protein
MARTKKITAIPTTGLTGYGAFRVQVSSAKLAALVKDSMRFAGMKGRIDPNEPAIIYRCNVKSLFRAVGKSPIRLALRNDRGSQALLAEVIWRLMQEAKAGNWPARFEHVGCVLELRTTAAQLKIASDLQSRYSPSLRRGIMTYKDASKKPDIQRTKSLPDDAFLLAVFPAREGTAPPVIPSAGEAVAERLKAEAGVYASTRIRMAHRFQKTLRSLDGLAPNSAAEGQAIAKQINDVLTKHGCQVVFPGAEDSAILVYLLNRATGPGAFALKGKKDGKLTTVSISRLDALSGQYVADFSQLEVRPAPLNDALAKFLTDKREQ